METNERITQLENEVKVLKNEVQAVLLDIRENVLNAENPFNASKPAVTSQQVVIERQVQTNIPQSLNDLKSDPSTANTNQMREEKSVKSVQTNETRTDDPMRTNHKNNGNKAETNEDDVHRTEYFEMHENRSGKRQPNLLTYAGLACWVEDTTRRLGKERTQALLEISEIAGFLPKDVRQILIKLTTIESNEHSMQSKARDYFDSLVKIAALCGNESDYNTALLQVLSQGDVHG